MNKEEVLDTINQLYNQIEYENKKGRTILNEYHELKKENTNLKQALIDIRDFINKVDGVLGERHKIVIKNKIDKVLGDEK